MLVCFYGSYCERYLVEQNMFTLKAKQLSENVKWLQFMSCEFCIKLLCHSFLWNFVVKLYRVKHVTVNVCITLEVIV